MPAVHIDQSQVVYEDVSCMDTDGETVETPAIVIPVVIPLDQIGEWDAVYDPSSGSSPNASNSRIIARAVLDAMQAHTEAP